MFTGVLLFDGYSWNAFASASASCLLAAGSAHELGLPMRPPSDAELDVAALQTTKRLERWVELKELEDVRRVGGPTVRRQKQHRGEEATYPKDWRRAALCLRCSGDWTELPNVPGQEFAKRRELAICQVCPVRWPCLEAGLSELTAIWGGYLPKQRRKIVRERKKAG